MPMANFIPTVPYNVLQHTRLIGRLQSGPCCLYLPIWPLSLEGGGGRGDQVGVGQLWGETMIVSLGDEQENSKEQLEFEEVKKERDIRELLYHL
jgi:hypothetical protein